MIKINQCDTPSLNKHFNIFSTQTLKKKHTDTSYVVSQMKQYEKQYTRLGIVDTFCEKAAEFAQKLGENKQYDFAGIIYSSLVKIPNIQPKQKELYAQKALEIAKLQGDPFHILARLADLKKTYKTNGSKRQYLDTLFAEEKQLRSIIENFENSKSQFKTVGKTTNTLETYIFQLAKTRVDISKCILRGNPEAAERKLNQARKTFVKMDKTKEIEFVDTLLSEIQKPQ